MKEISISPDAVALVDDADYQYLISHKWYKSNGYAINKKRVKMHRMILNPLPHQLIDHRDHNPLNNQRLNLRIANRFQNIHNQYKRVNTNNNYKGTSFVKRLGLWQARCRMWKEDHFLGHFKSEISAAYAYNKKALELSSFSLLNKLDFSIEELESMLITDRANPIIAEFQSGIKGINWNKWKKSWEVSVNKKYLGASKDLESAKLILNVSRETFT